MPAAAPADERRHEPGPEPLWGESWYFDFAANDASLGGYVRLGFYPNLGVAWYWACLVGPDRPLVTVIDHAVPLPRGRSLEIRTEGLWADHTVETPLDHFSLGCEAFGLAFDDPAEVYGQARGDRTPFGLDLEWETDGEPFAYPGVTRYEVPCRVHGEVLVGREELTIDGVGQRDHSWGVRDWWTMSWLWSAARLSDGTRIHATDVRYDGAPIYSTGYVQQPGQPTQAVGLDTDQPVDSAVTPGPEGLPSSGTVALGDLAFDMQPVAFAPVLLTAEDGRQSRFPRALCRYQEQAGERRSGVGWAEWNQPPSPPA